jgi:FkbM family methyltransferase
VKCASKQKTQKFKWKIINTILKFADPIVNVYVGQRKMKMLLSQKTPWFYAIFPTYDRALPRICELIQKIDTKLIIIDIGANIGDTAFLITEKVIGASILCIEGDKIFIPFLFDNISSLKNNNIFIEPKYCVDLLENNKFNIETKNGTAHLSISNDHEIENIDTLDNMVNNNQIFKKTNILKIDTDGFEITVLNGAKEFLQQVHPMIYFEFTPDAYVSNKQDPMDLINLLGSYGYEKALFYDNFGLPMVICKFSHNENIRKLIKEIDGKNICYYDILCIHNSDEEKYLTVLNNELNYYKK